MSTNGIGALQQAAGFTAQAAQIAGQSALLQAQVSRDMAAIEADGIAAQLQINMANIAASAQTDQAILATRAQMVQASKSLEIFALQTAFREKLVGMFAQIYEQQMANSWSRIKQSVSNMKF